MGTIIFNDSGDPESSFWFDGTDELISALEIVITETHTAGRNLSFIAGTGVEEPGNDGVMGTKGVVVLARDPLPTFTFDRGRVCDADIDTDLLESLQRFAQGGKISLDDDDYPW